MQQLDMTLMQHYLWARLSLAAVTSPPPLTLSNWHKWPFTSSAISGLVARSQVSHESSSRPAGATQFMKCFGFSKSKSPQWLWGEARCISALCNQSWRRPTYEVKLGTVTWSQFTLISLWCSWLMKRAPKKLNSELWGTKSK